jgi:ATP-binding cassette subfamily B protein
MRTWEYVWQLIRFRPGLFILNTILAIIIALMILAPGWLAREFFNTLEGTTVLGIGWVIALLVMTALGRVASNMGIVAVDVTFRFHTSALLSKNLFKHILSVSGSRALSSSSGEAVSRFRDDVQEAGVFIGYPVLIDTISSTFMMLVALAVMLWIDPWITISVFLPLMIVVVVANMASKRIEKYRSASRIATGEVTSWIGSVFGSIQAIQIGAAEKRVAKRFDVINEKRRKTSVKDRLFTELLNSIFMNMVNIGTGLVLLLAASKMQKGSFTVGDFALFVFNLSWISQTTLRYGMLLARYKQLGVSFRRMNELMQGADEAQLVEHGEVFLGKKEDVKVEGNGAILEKSTSENLAILEVSGLTYRYPHSSNGIEDITFCLRKGGLTVITGRIGSGKSTLLRTMIGLLPPEKGSIHWNDKQVMEPDKFFIPPRSGYTPQLPRLFSDSIRDNILMGIPEEEVDLKRVINLVAMDADLSNMDKGLDTVVGPKGVRLSGGQIQRTAIARMLVRETEIFVCDDLSSALDAETEKLIWDQILEQYDSAFLVVTHNRQLLRRADHIVLMKDGKVEAEGQLEELLRTSKEMQSLWDYKGEY